MSAVSENLLEVRSRIRLACDRVSREAASVSLIAVSKTFSAESIREVYETGHGQFGESRIQEAEPKIRVLPSQIEWHFIGRVQRNKVRKILQDFKVIHGIDSLRLASYVDEVARELAATPQVFLQVNLAGEVSKGGFSEADLLREMEGILALKHIDLIGLMCIPPADSNEETVRGWFRALRKLRDRLEVQFQVCLPSLSMGMSGDYELAIEEGATHVRVGSSIFGVRAYRVDGELG
jgi:pyridoxal phosphate enzyme (YggS family)